MPGLPPGFLEYIAPLPGDALAAFVASFDEPPRSGLRVNTLKIDAPALVERLPYDVEPLAWAQAGYVLTGAGGEPGPAPGKHPYHAAGLYYLQEPSAMAPAAALAPQPGERVLDLCAAPGGKTTQIAALMRSRGLLVANEIHPQRVWELAENLERCGVTHAAVLNETPEQVAGHFGAFFDRVLVDAPCSGEGMFRKSEAARRDWSPTLVQSCAMRQAGILDQAANLVRPGGRLVYSTCTFNLEENEACIAAFLARRSDFELLPAPAFPGSAAGGGSVLLEQAGLGKGVRSSLEQALRLWPHLLPGDGHFVAVMRRSGELANSTQLELLPSGASRRRGRQARGPAAGVNQPFYDFCRDSLAGAFLDRLAAGQIVVVGSYLYWIPEGLPDLGRLKVIHPGWWLGVIKTGERHSRFEPSHALALGLQPDEALWMLDLHLNDPALAAYLHGETLESAGPDGWLLVQVDGYALGWGKRTQGRVKNLYPKGLRQV